MSSLNYIYRELVYRVRVKMLISRMAKLSQRGSAVTRMVFSRIRPNIWTDINMTGIIFIANGFRIVLSPLCDCAIIFLCLYISSCDTTESREEGKAWEKFGSVYRELTD